MTSLFKHGSYQLHSGSHSTFKIDCDALTGEDWSAVAAQVCPGIVGSFGSVEPVLQGGLRFAEALEPYATQGGPVLIVDDVLTTGASMEEQRAGRDALGVVLFARGPLPSWVEAVFESRWL